jgi:hypothetical protein
MGKHMCADHEELYMNLLKPQMKVGNELVAKVSNKNSMKTFMKTPLIMPDVQNTHYRLDIIAYQE